MIIIADAKEVVAKKDHQCDFCHRQIRKGQTYINGVYKDDSIYNFRTHIECDKLVHELDMFDDAIDGVTADMFHEGVHEAYLDIMRKNIPKVVQHEVLDHLQRVAFDWKLKSVIKHYLKTDGR